MAAVAALSPPPSHAVIGKRGREHDELLLSSRKRHRCTSVDSVISDASTCVRHSESSNEDKISLAADIPIGQTSPNDKIFGCPYDGCNKAYNRPTRLKDHINTHTQERPHVCPHKPCTKTFLRQTHLARHINNAHSGVRNFACTYEGCNKTYATGGRLRRHVADTHEGKERFQCIGYEGCSQKFRKRKTLQSHIQKDHMNRKPFPCPLKDEATGEHCDKAYLTEGKLLDHQRKHHTPLQYICTQCSPQVDGNDGEVIPPVGVYFTTAQDLAVHTQQVHPPRCEACEQTFTTSRQLESHMETLHAGKTLEERKTFHCPNPGCGKAFTRQSNLNQHFRQAHEGSKRFVCGDTDLSRSKGFEAWTGDDACHANFASKQKLENHVKVQHLGLRTNETKNRKQRRQEKKGAQREAKGLSAIGALTGDGYPRETGRNIECIVAGCDHLFYRQYDLKVHAQATHGMEIEEVLEAIAEREALSGGRFWVGGIDPGQEDFYHLHNHSYDEFVVDGQSLMDSMARAMEPQAGARVATGDIIDPTLF